MRAFLTFLALPLTVAAVVILSGEAGAGQKKIVYESRQSGHWEIYAVNADGTGVKRLTDTPAESESPLWSPDGTKIVFTSDRDGNKEIYIMDAEGSGQTNLTRHAAQDYNPMWSPDGKYLSFVSDRDGNQEIYVIDVRCKMIDFSGDSLSPASGIPNPASCIRRLTQNEARDYSPHWSPDSRQIAFVSRRDDNYEIYTMDADGSHPVNLTHHPAEDGRGFHSWSPDGRRIAWGTDRDMNGDGNWEIYVMNADGSEPRNLTRTKSDEQMGMFVWSPDGRKIVFTTMRDGNSEIYAMNPDGSGVKNLSRHPAVDAQPIWSPIITGGPCAPPSADAPMPPDPAQPLAKPEGCFGYKVAFVSNRDGSEQVYVMGADGDHPQRLTLDPGGVRAPRWQP